MLLFLAGCGDKDDCDEQTWHIDVDGDGYGYPNTTETAFEAPSDYIADGTDCNDGTAHSFPGAGERCDGDDNDCDGKVDEDLLEAWYLDADGDGYGDPETLIESCDPGSGYVADGSDCDDTDDGIRPGAEELCDSVDNDCDGDTDEDVTTTFYADSDGDGYGDVSDTVDGCELPSGYVSNSTDCDDADPEISPFAEEVCDEEDNDCDGDTDEDATDAESWGVDADSDGACAVLVEACSAPSANAVECYEVDCDDSSDSRAPSLPESCDDGIDNDCDALVDCEDGDCASCGEYDCEDGLDDDGDGLTDCNDDECWGLLACALYEVEVTGGTFFNQRRPGGGGVRARSFGAASVYGELRGWDSADSAWETCTWTASWSEQLNFTFSGSQSFDPSRTVAASSDCDIDTSGFLPQSLRAQSDPELIYGQGWYTSWGTYYSWLVWMQIDSSARSSTSTGSYSRRYYDITGGDALRLHTDSTWTP